MFERLKHMLVKEFIQILRDPRMKGVIILMPIVQAMVFGYAVTTDVRNVPTAIYDLDNSVESREIVSRFVGSGYFRDVARATGDQRGPAARRRRDRSRRAAGQPRLRRAPSAPVAPRTLQLILDGTDSNTAGVVLNYAGTIAARYNDQVLATRLARDRRARLDAVESGHGDPRMVQPQPREPQLLRARRDRPDRHLDHPDALLDGGGAREGDRHHRADHGHAHHAKPSSFSARRCPSP